MAGNDKGTMSGLSIQEAREVHGGVMQMTFVYIAIALVAHFLMWVWKPWLG
jgi:light-harvesting complex 1 beta chain